MAEQTQPGAAQQPSTDAFAQAPPSGGEAGGSALPQMIGDLGIYGSALQFVPSTQVLSRQVTSTQTVVTPIITTISSGFISTTFTTTTVTVSRTVTSTVVTRRAVHVPIVSRGAFKISEDESPRPQDRVFIGYNYFADVSVPGVNTFQVHRETFGFEKAFLDGNASFGMRVPVIQAGGEFGFDDVGDLTFIGKYAFYNDRETGNLLSAGLAVTAPTGNSILLADGTTLHSTLLQPYVGWIWRADRFYSLGFGSVVVPTDSRDVTFGAFDAGFGYLVTNWLAPTFEAHVNTAFNHRGFEGDPIGFADNVVLTGGFHSFIGRSILTAGVAVPVTGPRIYDVEAIVQFNFRF
jgi:hypothetical protein